MTQILSKQETLPDFSGLEQAEQDRLEAAIKGASQWNDYELHGDPAQITAMAKKLPAIELLGNPNAQVSEFGHLAVRHSQTDVSKEISDGHAAA